MDTIMTTEWPRMTADEFVAWAMVQPQGQNYELYKGRVVAISPERWRHAVLKTRIAVILTMKAREIGLVCDVTADGVSVRIDGDTTFVPDVLLRCGPPPDDNVLEIDDPMIVVEVLSQSTATRDGTVKLAGYFSLPSVQHYLLVSGEEKRIVHHRRITDTEFATKVVGSEPIQLDPPGLALSGVFD